MWCRIGTATERMFGAFAWSGGGQNSGAVRRKVESIPCLKGRMKVDLREAMSWMTERATV